MALTDNLISYWKLTEASGSRADSQGSETLTDINTVTGASGGPPPPDLAWSQFTRANGEYLNHADDAALSTGDVDFCFAAWVYADSIGTNRGILGKWNGSTNEYALWINVTGAGQFSWVVRGSSAQTQVDDTGTTPATGTWYYIVVWHDSVANTINIQINDGTVYSTAKTDGANDSDSQFCIGSYQPVAAQCWDGRIASVGFWKRVLSSAERTELYNSGSGKAWPWTAADATMSAAVCTATALSSAATMTAASVMVAVVCTATARAWAAVMSPLAGFLRPIGSYFRRSLKNWIY